MNKILLGLLILLGIGVVIFIVVAFNNSNNNVNNDQIRTIIINGSNFKFTVNGVDNPNITVKRGERIKIKFESIGGFHDWVVDEFGAATQKVNPGTVTTTEFVADKTGTFEYYCSVGQHRANGMEGNLIVE